MAKIGSFFSILFFALVSFAQEDVSVSATVDRNKVGVGQTFTLRISVLSQTAQDIQSPSPPSFEHFKTSQYLDGFSNSDNCH